MYYDNFKSFALFQPPPAILRGSAKINVLLHLFRNKRPFLYLKPLKGWVMKRMNEVVKERVIILADIYLVFMCSKVPFSCHMFWLLPKD